MTCALDFSGCAAFNLQQWADFISIDGKSFYKKANMFFATKFANILVESSTGPTMIDHPYQCPTCSKWLKSFHSFSGHMFAKHGVKNPMRRYVGDEKHCVFCLKHFWTRERLINIHLRRSKVCRNMHLMNEPPLSELESEEFDKLDRMLHKDLQHSGHRRHKAKLPCVQLAGPLPPLIVLNPSAHHRLGRGHHSHST